MLCTCWPCVVSVVLQSLSTFLSVFLSLPSFSCSNPVFTDSDRRQLSVSIFGNLLSTFDCRISTHFIVTHIGICCRSGLFFVVISLWVLTVKVDISFVSSQRPYQKHFVIYWFFGILIDAVNFIKTNGRRLFNMYYIMKIQWCLLST